MYNLRMHSITKESVNKSTSEPGIGKVILKDILVIVVATTAILAFYFFVKAFSILANIP